MKEIKINRSNIFIILFFLFYLTLLSENNKKNDIRLLGFEDGKGILTITGSCYVNKVIKIGESESKEYDLLKLEVNNCFNSGKYGSYNLPIFSKLISLPETGNFIIKTSEYQYDEFDLPNNEKIAPVGYEDNLNISKKPIYKEDKWYPENVISISKPNIMRGLRFSQVSISTIQYNSMLNRYRVIKDLDIELEIDITKTENPLKKKSIYFNNRFSDSFSKIGQNNIYGYTEKNYIRGKENLSENYAGNYLIVIPDALEDDIKYLVRWKNKLGFKNCCC